MIDVEGIARTSAGSQTVFSLGEDEEGSHPMSIDVGNELVVLNVRAFWCAGGFSKGLVD